MSFEVFRFFSYAIAALRELRAFERMSEILDERREKARLAAPITAYQWAQDENRDVRIRWVANGRSQRYAIPPDLDVGKFYRSTLLVDGVFPQLHFRTSYTPAELIVDAYVAANVEVELRSNLTMNFQEFREHVVRVNNAVWPTCPHNVRRGEGCVDCGRLLGQATAVPALSPVRADPWPLPQIGKRKIKR